MFQKFDEEAQKVLKIAKKEMQELKHEYVGTEHLMLGILKCNNSVSKLLNKYSVNYDNFKKNVIKLVGMGKSTNNLFLYTPLLKILNFILPTLSIHIQHNPDSRHENKERS